jgi:hypothetical protein
MNTTKYMEFPDDILRIIREFSKPLTRPDWRRLNRLPLQDLYHEIMEKKNNPKWRYTNILLCFVYDIQRGKPWNTLYDYAVMYGVRKCSEKYGIQYSVLYSILSRNNQIILN